MTRDAVIELAQAGDVRDCCGERYLLVEQQQGSLVRRWYALADNSEQRPLAACRRCTTVLLPHTATQRPVTPRARSYTRARKRQGSRVTS
jgi:hypothetical protein